MQPSHTPVFVTVADTLARDIARGDIARLPGARALAARYECSFATMLKALRLLRERGIIEVHGNRRARIAGQRPSSPSHAALSSRSAAERLGESIRRSITDGVFRAGNVLPKAEYFAIEHGCSRTTVAKALRSLENEGLCYRRGRSWVVGSLHAIRPVSSSGHGGPAVLVLLPSEDHWRSLCREPKEYRRFAAQFAAESEKMGIRLVMAFTNRQPSAALRERWPQGQAQIAATLARLDTHYLGALVPCDHIEIPDLEHWLRWLCEKGHPVVWLDRKEEGLRSPIRSRLFHRFHADSTAGARTVIEAFHEAGHRHVGIPRFFSHIYMDSFIEDMREIAPALSPPMRLTVLREPYPTMDADERYKYPGDILRRLRRRGVPVVRTAVSDILARHPGLFANEHGDATSWHELWRGTQYVQLREFQIVWLSTLLVPLLRDPTVTGLVCPGNKNTRFWFWWCDAARVAVPRDISLISVDNSYDFHPWPMSSIDLGYDYLGYAAVHVFVGDVPVRVSRDRTVTGSVRFLDRGSLGRPRSQRLRVDLEGELL